MIQNASRKYHSKRIWIVGTHRPNGEPADGFAMQRKLRRQLTNTLEKLGLLGFMYSSYLRLVEFNPVVLGENLRYYRRKAPDGFPIPSTNLRNLIGAPDISGFLDSGRLIASSLQSILDRNGRNLQECKSILDFGCGCGRVIRHLRYLSSASKLHGCDYNPELVAWCKQNIPFADFSTTSLEPPTSYSDGQFDFIFAFSVFTHLPEVVQNAWMREYRRILMPSGLLYITTHGESSTLGRLDPRQQEEFKSGLLVVKRAKWAGTNLCAVYHPERYVREKLSKGFEVLDFIPGQTSQDVYLLKKET